jgi:DNA-binding response OmpR family regulator
MDILLIEDDQLVGQGIVNGLANHGHSVRWVQTGEAGLTSLAILPDLLILDLNLPDIDGISLLKKFRRQGGSIPVLILTAKDAIDDRIIGLDAGADDYFLKPFSIKELEARVRALYRRSHGRTDEYLTYGDLTIDTQARRVVFNKVEISLGRREYELLVYLVEHQGQVVTRRRLEDVLYGTDEDIESNTLEVHVHNLRKKISKTIIRTIRGVGYEVENMT